MLDTRAFVNKHQSKGVLMDANLLLQFLVWRTDRRRVHQFTPGDAFEVKDFLLLEKLVAHFGKLITTPHILTEVSNLAKLHGNSLRTFRQVYKAAVEEMEEFYDESRAVVRDTCFMRLGLTDAAVAVLARRSILVMTLDLDLWLALQGSGLDAINFNHLRPRNWR